MPTAARSDVVLLLREGWGRTMPMSACYMYANIIADSIIFNNPGQQITLSNAVITINSLLTADGTCNGLTTIQTTSGTGTFKKTSGTVTLNYVLLKNITGTGGATFVAN